MAYELGGILSLGGDFVAQMQKALDVTERMEKQANQTSKQVNDMSKMQAIGQKISAGLGQARDAFGAVGIASAGFLKGCIDGAGKAQKINADLAQTIKSTGGAAGLTADQVIQMANGLSKVTTFGAGTIKQGQNMLLTFTNIGKETFPMATQAMLDMAQKMGTEPVAASIQLGKALNDPSKGLTALTRVGVTFTEQQKKQIEAMQKAGNMAGAQKVILNELNREFGGQAQAAANTYDGKMKQLGNTIAGIKTAIGTSLLPYVQKAAEAFLQIAQKIQSIPKPTMDVIAKVLGLVAVFGSLIGGTSLLKKVFSTLFPTIGGIGDTLGKLKGPIGIIIVALSALTYAYVHNLGGFKNFVDGVISKAVPMFNAVTQGIQNLINTGTIGSKAVTMLSDAFGRELGSKIGTALTVIRDGIIIFKDVLQGNFGAAQKLISSWSDSGSNNIMKVLNTVRIAGTGIRAAVFGVIGFITGNFKTFETVLTQGFGMSSGSAHNFANSFQEIRSVVIAILRTLGEVIKAVFGFVISHGTAIINIMKLIAAGFVAVKVAIAIFNAIKIAVAAFNIIMNVTRGIIMAVRIAQLLLNVAFMMNPFAVIIIAIVAFIAILVLLWNKNAAFRNFIIGCWNAIKSGVSSVLSSLASFIQKSWQSIENIVSNVISAIKNIAINVFKTISTGVMAIVQPFINGITNIFNHMKTGLTNMLNGLKNIFQGVWNLIKLVVMGPVLLICDLVTGNFGKLKSDATKIMQGISNALSQIWTGIKQFISGYVQALVGFVIGYFENAKNNILAIWNAVSSFLSGIWNGILNFCKAAWNGMLSAISSILQSIGNFISNAWNGILNFFASLPSKLYQHGTNMINGLRNGIVSVMGSVSSAISNGLNSAISFISSLPAKFVEWGADMINGLVKGIKSTIGAVGNAVSGVADKIRSFLHFSRPDTGPLADYETFMPDFMKGMAGGIKSNMRFVVDATKNVATGIRENVIPKSDKITNNTVITNNNKTAEDKGITIMIPKLADQVVIREESDIDKVATAFVKKLKGTSFNMA